MAAPRVRVVPVHRPPLGAERTYLVGRWTGLGITMRHVFRNVILRKDTDTIEYPEVKPPYPPRMRGVHRLMKRADGSPRCVACMMCPTACPARCITIVPAERADDGEKRPALFEIDELRCVVCGLCVEACPCDALRMDTGVHMPPQPRRAGAILGLDELLSRGELSTATQGGEGQDWDRKEPAEERGPTSRVPAAPR
jgi:NADH-quinone oxidoreductase subunit I